MRVPLLCKIKTGKIRNFASRHHEEPAFIFLSEKAVFWHNGAPN